MGVTGSSPVNPTKSPSYERAFLCLSVSGGYYCLRAFSFGVTIPGNNRKQGEQAVFFEWSVIFLITLAAEGLRLLLPLPIPSSIYGLVLLFLLLLLKVIKPERIRKTSSFLLRIMPVLFVPPGVGILESLHLIKPAIVPILLITSLSTAMVMAASAYVSQKIMQRGRNNENA